jgi:hypothetical protein
MLLGIMKVIGKMEHGDYFLINRTELGKPYHLIEGHLQLNYFRELYRDENQRLKEQHAVWIVTLKD